MTEHLIRLGRQRIAYLYGPDNVYNTMEPVVAIARPWRSSAYTTLNLSSRQE